MIVEGATPGRTPFDESDMTPTYFSETPMTNMPTPLRRARAAPDLRYDPTLSLDTFQSRYTSEDNSSFAVLLSKDNAARREKFSWAWDAEKKANQKAIKGREAREQLVEMTRKMVESDANGCVTLIQGAPGRPGERKMLVQGATGDMGRLMVGGTKESGRLMLEDGKGKGKGQLEYVDMDKPTAEEEEEGRFLRQEEMQVPMEGFTFTVRTQLILRRT
jgi:protein DGCR14